MDPTSAAVVIVLLGTGLALLLRKLATLDRRISDEENAQVRGLEPQIEGPPFEYNANGGLGQVREHIDRILRNSANQGTLIIEVVEGSGDEPRFVQFTGGATGLEMDFPLVTPAQRKREQAIRRFMAAHGQRVRTTMDVGRTQSLDIDLPADVSLVADLTEGVFTEVFAVSSDVRLRFSGENLGVAA